jgi:hypothetical protein
VLEAGTETDWVVRAAPLTAGPTAAGATAAGATAAGATAAEATAAGARATGARATGARPAGATAATEVVVMGTAATCIPDGAAAGARAEGMKMLLGAVTAAGMAACCAKKTCDGGCWITKFCAGTCTTLAVVTAAGIV